MHERARDDELLPHAMTVRIDEFVAPVLEVEETEQFAPTMFYLSALLAVQTGDKAEELHPGELLIDERPVGNEAQPSLCLVRPLDDIDATDPHAPRRGTEDPRNHAQRRRLAGPVRPEEAEQLPGRDMQVERVDRGKRAVLLGELLELNHALGRRMADGRWR